MKLHGIDYNGIPQVAIAFFAAELQRHPPKPSPHPLSLN